MPFILRHESCVIRNRARTLGVYCVHNESINICR